MPVETRWYRNEQATVNGLTAYKLDLAKITTGYTFSRTVTRYILGGYVCIDVYKRSAAGVETLIASKVAVIETLDGDYHVTRSATVDIPLTSLNPGDSIVIRVYWRFATETTWTLCATFTTEVLGAQSLDAATWTCYYTVSHTSTLPARSTMDFYIDGTDLSRIEGFSWTPSAPPVVKKPIMKLDKGPHPRSRLQFKPTLKNFFGFTTRKTKLPYNASGSFQKP